jgi:RNA polymerase sigma-70 factor, ECF subfamily
VYRRPPWKDSKSSMSVTDRAQIGGWVLACPFVDDDAALVERLRAGHEQAFVELVQRYQSRLLRLAEATVRSGAVAQEVTQDTWLAVVRGVDRFEGRSSFKTWLFHILVNRARSAARREQRAGVADESIDEHFLKDGHWANPPEPWAERADDRLVAAQLATRVRELLPLLPDAQREVVMLRDVEGLDADEVSTVLEITDGNQRVLLHRGRAKLRHLLAQEVLAT